jgi:hypothetical protein
MKAEIEEKLGAEVGAMYHASVDFFFVRNITFLLT